MTPEEVGEARRKLGLSLAEFARLIGYSGRHARTAAHKLETTKPPSGTMQRLIRAIEALHAIAHDGGSPAIQLRKMARETLESFAEEAHREDRD
ncbi:MAG: hypothetical protein KDJ90_00740 [Nitratireductor sp.]|nr:hypothetical protein [Nitratireductor sp.]